MYRLLFCLLLCLNSSAGAAQILINEFLASNASVNSDNEYGAFSDWVELYNPGSNPVNLDGWHLSDSGDPLKWAFPSGTTIS
ncbi:MAG: lamin tail domain-containing protein, partial [Saprospiraceae bacterium]|nr:lamin tail domain-containing protein [Saprospiraceae bacterium]